MRRRVREQAAADAEALEAIATDPALGAPAEPRDGDGESGYTPYGPGARAPADTDRSAIPSAVGAVGDGSGAGVLLLVGLIGTAAVIGGVAVSRRRSGVA
ncbi:MAG TPA: hypothetical protein VGW10_03615 [Solirubrobacteraceae bacterium]|nr:hypothetical protein [Solirubrobacteraceae bacterium]